MKTLILLVCMQPNIINKTKTWNDLDQQTLKRAQVRCQELYSDAPCLKTFIKKEELLYNAICGNKW